MFCHSFIFSRQHSCTAYYSRKMVKFTIVLCVFLIVAIAGGDVQTKLPHRIQYIGRRTPSSTLLFERHVRVPRSGPIGIASISLRFPPEGRRNREPIGAIIVIHHYFTSDAHAYISRGRIGLNALYLDINSARGGDINAWVQVWSE